MSSALHSQDTIGIFTIPSCFVNAVSFAKSPLTSLYLHASIHRSRPSENYIAPFSLDFCSHLGGSVPFHLFLFPNTEMTCNLTVGLFKFEF